MEDLVLRLREQALRLKTQLLVCAAMLVFSFRFREEIFFCLEIVRLRIMKEGPWGPVNVLDAPASCKSTISADCLIDAAVARFVTDQLYHAKRVFELFTDCGVPAWSVLDTIKMISDASKIYTGDPQSMAVEGFARAFSRMFDQVHGLVYIGVRRYVETTAVGMVMIWAAEMLHNALILHAMMMDSRLTSWTRAKSMYEKKRILTQIPPMVVKRIGWRGFERMREYTVKSIAQSEEAVARVAEAVEYAANRKHQLEEELAAIPSYKYWWIYRFFMGSPGDDEIKTELDIISSLEPRVELATRVMHDVRQNVFDLQRYFDWYNSTMPRIMASYRPTDLLPFEDEVVDVALSVDRMLKDGYAMATLSDMGWEYVGLLPTYRRRNQRRLDP